MGTQVPQGDAIPHEVVGLTVKKGYTLVRAWREYLRLTQAEVAERMGISQAAPFTDGIWGETSP
jgi:predicted transcriptional regulator